MSRPLRQAEKAVFRAVLALSARLARMPAAGAAIVPLMRGLAALTRLARGARVLGTTDPEVLARTWQASMPSPRSVPIIAVEGDTARAEIRMPCPLRGSGDLAACHRLMAYDRALLAPHGARFVVLRSQAEPGVEVCEVAIRAAALPHDDLVPAHRLAEPRSARSAARRARALP